MTGITLLRQGIFGFMIRYTEIGITDLLGLHPGERITICAHGSLTTL